MISIASRRAAAALELMRPEQWIKNGFVFLPAFFAGNLLNADTFLESLTAFVAFCFACSAIYCLNDVVDADRDRLHPAKFSRPIASGRVTKEEALVLVLLCEAVSASIVCGVIFVDGRPWIGVGACLLAYTVLNAAYCLELKRIPIVDVFCIATGFVLRLAVGSFATGIALSRWVVILTFLLALFLAFAKRRDDVAIYESTGMLMRPGIDRYSLDYINAITAILAAVIVVAYLMYSLAPSSMDNVGSDYLYLTSIYVIAALCRYLQIAIVEHKSGNPTRILLKDRFILACVALWACTFAGFLYV